MKKILAIICAICCIFSFVACNNNNQSTSSEGSQNASSSSVEQSSQVPASSSNNQAQYDSVEINVDKAPKIFFEGSAFSTTGIFARAITNGMSSTLGVDKCTFDIPSNVSELGSHTIKVSVGEFSVSYDIVVIKKPVVENNEIKIIVDKNYTGAMSEVDSNGYSQFNSLTDVFTALKGAFDDGVIKNIKLLDQTYEEKLDISIKNVHLFGVEGGNSTISFGDCAQTKGTDGSATVTVKGSGFWAKNIVFENSYDYINGTENDKQALALLNESDCSILENCTFLGYQDTLQAKNNRQYYKNCVIKGTTDFIFGKAAVAVFDNCEIVTRFTKEGATNNGYITAHSGYYNTAADVGKHGMVYGYVFLGCNLTCEEGVLDASVSLGRPWRFDATVAWINCQMGSHIATAPYGTEGATKTRYTYMSGGNRENLPSEANFVEYGNTGLGAVLVDSDDFTLLDETTYQDYTDLSKIFATTNGMVTFATAWDVEADLATLASK